MAESSTDLRVIKTRRNIEGAFIRLLEREGFSSITVQQILEEALINRKTFYRYYRDKYDLAEQMIRAFCGRLEELFLERSKDDFPDPESVVETARSAYRTLYDDRRTILALWDVRTGEVDFYATLHSRMQEKYKGLLKREAAPGADLDLESYLTATLMLQTLKYMLASGREYTPEEMLCALKDVYQFLSRGMN